MTHNLQDLADKRDALLLAEVAMWLHMLGKFHKDFLNDPNSGIDIQIPTDLTANFTQLDNLLQDSSWSGSIWNQLGITELQGSSLSFFNFIEKHRDPDPAKIVQGLLRLIHDSHGRGSGIEKGVLNRFAVSQVGKVYLSTAFGTESKAIDLKQTEWHKFYTFLQTHIQILENSLTVPKYDWKGFRKYFISQLESYFRQTVAETRRPLSDVSLFDQTSASVAFLKAALAQNLLAGWKEPVTDIIKDKYYWRVLKVGLDGLAFWGDSVRIGDLLARKELIGKALDLVQRVIEEQYPLGLEIYRDENGSVFIVPDIADLLNWKTKSGCLLCEYLQRIANFQFKGEARWVLKLSDHTRDTLKFGRLATSKPNKLSANDKTIASHWNIQEKQDICPICSLRPIGSSNKALKLKVCDVCYQRRTNRAKAWTKNLHTTIWIDEVADTNGRLALIVGRFELESWLTGEAFNSIVSSDPQSQIWKEPKGSKQHNFDYQNLLNEIQNALSKKPENKRQFVSNTLLDGLVSKNSRGLRKGQNPPLLQPFYNLQVTDTDLGEGRTSEDPYLLALAMMRQNPSFARLRRVWETTQKFWQEIIADVPDTQLSKVKCRLNIQVKTSEISRLKLVNFGNYDLVLKNAKLSVLLWDDRLITTDNLCYVAKQLNTFSDNKESENINRSLDSTIAAEFVRSHLNNQQVSIEEPTGYGNPNKLGGQLDINSNDITLDFTECTPVIQILAEPRTFMALVPAEKSLEVINTIQTKYDREMGKVRNRLPLHLGVVYFHRRTPLRAALDAGRQMLTYKSPTDKQLWHVQSTYTGQLPKEKAKLANGTKQFDQTITLTLTQDERSITWHVPAKMGDGNTPDNWYPYVFLETNDDDSKVKTERNRAIKSQRPGTTEPCWLVHPGDLKKGDQIYFTPSTFDFEYLDSTARRFEIHYDKEGRRPRQTRPFYLEDLDRFQTLWEIMKNLQTSQCHQVIYTIEATREMWYGQNEQESWTDAVFKQFVTDTLTNAAWPKDKKWPTFSDKERQQLIDAGVRGELADLAELYMKILKEQ
ncbi:CRISPR-associated protein, Csx11 family (plasmid) [Cylindrospermum stagnale PCC 7417]|uniref:CRISPR-associated protein, Csx11 family n=1 Tax=Cylindrospermum stagnale PCC 7417 TaxID=56107 RepID=K9X808_9NOST|nr:CRISPR-associated protein Csx11 [Cylindrospermum stagnale]AFZ28588.1 CRISPR-associated protein, Csx11 family [Cylindrospermum stagnale PCC 7417]